MTASEQLQRRKETIAQLNSWIVELITNPEGLEEAILKPEETQDKILEKIKFVELQGRTTTTPSPPVPTPLPVTSSVTLLQPETVSCRNTTTCYHLYH